MLFTFVTPFKNSADTIARCIASIKNQTLTDFESILIDDGSTDETLDIAYSLSDDRFRIIKNPINLGVSTSRNIVNKLSKGDIICVLDADDEAINNRLESTKLVFENFKNVDLLAAGVINSADNSVYIPTNYDAYCLTITNPFVHSCIAYKKSFINENNITYNPSYIVAHDYDFYKEAYLNAGIFAVSNNVVSIRHDLPTGLMATQNI